MTFDDEMMMTKKMMMMMMTYDDDQDDKSVDFQDRARSSPLPGWLLAWPKIDVRHNSVSVGQH